jgi:hypothetical protein
MSLTRILIPVTAAMFALPLATVAADRGVNEVAGMASYTDVGLASTTNINLGYGRYLTPQHEVGGSIGYTKTDVDDLGSVDGTTLGAFYQFNFDSGEMMVPFIGVDLAYISGDLGDVYDFGYGATAGLKLYPYEHAGIVIGVSYQRLQGAEDFIDDEDGFNVNVGLSLRF